MSGALIRYVLTAAMRDRLFISITVLFVCIISLSLFMGATALTEQASFALVFTAGALRIGGVLGLVLFVTFFIRRSFESGNIEFLLSKPISRIGFILSYTFSLSLLAAGLTLLQAVCIYLLSADIFSFSHVFWLLTLLLENVIMINTAFFFALVLKSPSASALSAFGFYILSRMMGQILGIIDSGLVSDQFKILEWIIQVISAVMPRLDLMGQTSWLLYGIELSHVDLMLIGFQGAAFVFVITIASLSDLVRRAF